MALTIVDLNKCFKKQIILLLTSHRIFEILHQNQNRMEKPHQLNQLNSIHRDQVIFLKEI